MSGHRWKALWGIGLAGILAVALAGQPQQVTIEKCGSKKAAVEFDHAQHMKLESECSTCHHTQEDLTATSGEAEKCRGCHLEPGKENVPDCTEMSPKKNPYHLQCVGCHKTAVEADPETAAPTKCDECHPKP